MPTSVNPDDETEGVRAELADTVEGAVGRALQGQCLKSGWALGRGYYRAALHCEGLVATRWFCADGLCSRDVEMRVERETRATLLAAEAVARGTTIWSHADGDAAVAVPCGVGRGTALALVFFLDRARRDGDEREGDRVARISRKLGAALERWLFERVLFEKCFDRQLEAGVSLQDGVGQMLTGASYLARSLADRLRSGASDDCATAELLSGTVQAALSEIRELVAWLRPVDMDGEGLTAAVDILADRLSRQFGVACVFRTNGPARIDDVRLANQLYSLAEDAVRHFIRYHAPTTIVITLEREDSSFVLTVSDDSDGASPDHFWNDEIGLRFLKHRSRVLGASLTISPGDGGGTRLKCRLEGQADMVNSVHTDSRATAKVLIVDDHPIVRYGLSQLIGDHPDLDVVGTAGSALEALEQIDRHRPDLIVIDLSLGTSNGLDLIKRIHARDDTIKMLVSSIHDEALYAGRAVRAGANGYVAKHEATTKIVDAIRHVLAGGTYLSEQLRQSILRGRQRPREDPMRPIVERLSDRELEVFELIGRGQGTREIAEHLHVSRKTIEAHRESIKSKLQLASGPELVRHAVHWVLESERAITSVATVSAPS